MEALVTSLSKSKDLEIAGFPQDDTLLYWVKHGGGYMLATKVPGGVEMMDDELRVVIEFKYIEEILAAPTIKEIIENIEESKRSIPKLLMSETDSWADLFILSKSDTRAKKKK